MEVVSRDSVLERLRRLDVGFAALLEDGCERYRMVIVGGSTLLLLGVSERVTEDIDALEAPAVAAELLDKYDINTRVCAYADNFAYNYEERLVPIVSGRRIDFFTSSLEDIVIAKLCAGREKDIQDITSDKVLAAIDWERLERLATGEDEVRASFLSAFRYAEFLSCYDRFVERWKPCKSLHLGDFSMSM